MLSNPADTSIQYLKGVGPAKVKLLASLGVHTVQDLLHLFPFRFEDRSSFTPIAMLKVGEIQTITGQVLVVGKRNFYSRSKTFEITVEDQSGRVHCAWFNQPFLDKYFKVGQEVVFMGGLMFLKIACKWSCRTLN